MIDRMQLCIKFATCVWFTQLPPFCQFLNRDRDLKISTALNGVEEAANNSQSLSQNKIDGQIEWMWISEILLLDRWTKNEDDDEVHSNPKTLIGLD